ncbi:Putative osmoprotectant uptake system substrate-binding protein OsmF precursor [Halomonas sp. THAF12]|uniref:glycine betaine ABC transporter substrate-binding protein n=1 Tax=Halomonas sp. THAF12 TaxID=2587849 RepID=UPI0012693896|nr:glycine betaine ABC transporter substrate-binding protein [Halomonas sp. THAF12]QFT83789.1 Putative osmoprotectant uptake system substrate-binding protein OsmF precursor [Halomonas sp. THAF12]
MKRVMMTLSGLALAGAMTSAQANEINVGGKNYTEQLILANMTELYLDDLGYDVTRRDGMGSAVLRQAQENGQIDLYWEYTGTSLIVYNDISESLSREATYDKVKELDAEKGLVWLEPSDANNTYAMAMREDHAEEHGIATLEDLADEVNNDMDLTVGLDTEFYSRNDGWRPLQETYDFKVGRSDIVRMDTGLMYSALRDSEVDVAVVFSTDGRVPAFDLRILEDTKGYFPAYALTPVVREETLEANPELAEQMNALSALLDDETMASLNARVDVERETIEDVAQSFLEEQDLI